MANNTWLRLYTDIINDRKIRRLPISYKWIWIIMLCLAKESPEEGKLLLSENIPVNLEDISDYAQLEIEEIKKAIEMFKKLNMVHEDGDVYIITNWNKRQYVSDNSTERVRRYRERIKNNETDMKRFRNVSETPPDTDSDTDTYTDTEYLFINKNKKNLNFNHLGGKNENLSSFRGFEVNGEYQEYSRWLEGTEDIPSAYIPEFLRENKEH